MHKSNFLISVDQCDAKYFCVIKMIIVTNDSNRYRYQQIRIPVPGAPDPPKLWLAERDDKSFVVEWSEPKSYGIPVRYLFSKTKRNIVLDLDNRLSIICRR